MAATPVNAPDVLIEVFLDSDTVMTSPVASGRTNVSGNVNFNLVPGTYKVRVGGITGYTFATSVVVKEGVTTNGTANPVRAVAISANVTTTCTVNYDENA